MLMKKRLLCGMLALALLAGLLGGCGGPGPAGDQSTEEIVDLGGLLDEGIPLSGAPAISTMLMPMASGTKVQSNSSATIDYSNAQDGYIMVAWTGGGSPKLKVQVKGSNSGETYTYNQRSDGQYDTYPLSDGNGKYSITVFKNVEGTKYSNVISVNLDVTLSDQFAPFIRPNQYVNYTEGSEVVKKAAELCSGQSDNLKKVEKVYDFVVGNLTYDKEKAQTVQSGYLPNVDSVMAAKKGICFDYAALMAAMLRSQNVPCKLVVGYAGDAYHAWINVWSEEDGWVDNAIYFDGKDWKLMDPTFASTGNQSESIMQYIGNGSNYTAKYLY